MAINEKKNSDVPKIPTVDFSIWLTMTPEERSRAVGPEDHAETEAFLAKKWPKGKPSPLNRKSHSLPARLAQLAEDLEGEGESGLADRLTLLIPHEEADEDGSSPAQMIARIGELVSSKDFLNRAELAAAAHAARKLLDTIETITGGSPELAEKLASLSTLCDRRGYRPLAIALDYCMVKVAGFGGAAAIGGAIGGALGAMNQQTTSPPRKTGDSLFGSFERGKQSGPQSTRTPPGGGPVDQTPGHECGLCGEGFGRPVRRKNGMLMLQCQNRNCEAFFSIPDDGSPITGPDPWAKHNNRRSAQVSVVEEGPSCPLCGDSCGSLGKMGDHSWWKCSKCKVHVRKDPRTQELRFAMRAEGPGQWTRQDNRRSAMMKPGESVFIEMSHGPVEIETDEILQILLDKFEGEIETLDEIDPSLREQLEWEIAYDIAKRMDSDFHVNRGDELFHADYEQREDY